MNKVIMISWQFSSFHCWPEAPEEVAFLRYPHRHLFKCKAELPVFHNDRDLEFFLVKNFLVEETSEAIDSVFKSNYSCEMMAEYFIQKLIEQYGQRDYAVEVWEDGENGARISL